MGENDGLYQVSVFLCRMWKPTASLGAGYEAGENRGVKRRGAERGARVVSVAVVIPAHSYPQYLPDAINSIEEQTVSVGKPIIVLDYPKVPEKYDGIENYAKVIVRCL